MKKENNIDLSIIIPVYNGEKYIKDCLDSIYNTYEKIPFVFETIIIDDGSKDNSEKIYKAYEKKYNNVIVKKNSNHGVSFSRNNGIDIASGKYVMFVDCDDMLLENWHKTLEKYLSYKKDVILLSKKFINQKDESIDKKTILSYITTYNDSNIRIPGPCSKLFSLNFIKENEIKFKEKIINGEDMLFCLEAIMKCENYLLIKDSIYIVRHNRFSSTSTYNKKIIESEIDFNMEVNRLFKKYNFWSPEIEKYGFLISIRCLSYRLGYMRNYKSAKEIYQIIINNDFYRSGLKKYKYKEPMKRILLYNLFKYKMCFLVYAICKIKTQKNKKETYEVL